MWFTCIECDYEDIRLFDFYRLTQDLMIIDLMIAISFTNVISFAFLILATLAGIGLGTLNDCER